jgi:tetratricopeptide (TPR) repeat protein
MNENDLDVLQARLDQTKEALKLQPEEVALRLAYVRDFLNFATTRNKEKNEKDRDYPGFLKEIREELQSIHEQSKDYPETYFLMGTVLNLLDNVKGAEDAYLFALKLRPDYRAARLSLAHLYEGQDRAEDARTQLKEALTYAPLQPAIWWALAQFYQEQNELLQAKECYQTVVELRPNDSIAYFSLGRLLMQMQNPEDARPALSEAVRLAPDKSEPIAMLIECLHDESFMVGHRYDDSVVAEREEAFKLLESLNPEQAMDTRQRFQQRAVR